MVVISGTGVLSDVIAAMRQGADDYITKPIHDMDEIAVVVERVLDKAHLKAERDRYQREIEQLNRTLAAEVDRQTQDLLVQNRRLMALNRVSYAISTPLDLDTILNRAIDAAIAAVEADGGVVRLLNPATDQLVVAASRGLPESYLASVQPIPLGQGIIGQVAQSGRPQGREDIANDSWLALLGESTGFRSYLCAPLHAGDRVLGTLGVAMRTEHSFDSHEIELLANIGNQVGVAVARAQHAADLEQANADLRRLDTLREQFIQNVAHELRTPLALVHGYVEMLTQGDLDVEERQVALNVASQRVRGLVDLVESITILQDLDSQPLRIEQIAPSELIQTALQMAEQRAMHTGIELHSMCPPDLPLFPGDFTRLAQTLHQLLDNACKFSPKGSVVTVTARATQDRILVSVSDQGIGIPAEEQAHIFERFYQIDGSTSRRYGGTGLGLAIAREIIEAHGGKISVQSSPGEGSTFQIELAVANTFQGADLG